jgi:hypothetical protein
MGFLSGQSFLESIDDTRTVYTCQQQFEYDSVEVFQDSLALLPNAYNEIDTLRIRFLDPLSHQVWTYSATANTMDCAGHGLADGTEIMLWSSVRGGLPTGLLRTRVYYVVNGTPDTFQVALTVGGSAVVFPQTSSGILYLAETEAPLAANGILHYNCVTLDSAIEGSTTIGFWTINDFELQYADGTALATIQDVLHDADDMIQTYTTATSYATALTGVTPYWLFRRVQGELAFRLLSNRPNAVRQVSSSEKEYADNVKRLKQTYVKGISTLVKLSLQDILSQLIEYKKPETTTDSIASAYLDCWGTGRFFGIVNAEDDPLTGYP